MRKFHKKGQFYIFLALILLAYVAGIRPTLDTIDNTRTAYTVAHKNFLTESTVVINNALFDELNVITQLDTFVDSFIDYQQTQGVNVSVIYLLQWENSLYIRNEYKDVQVTFTNETYELGRDATLTLSKRRSVDIDASEYEYYSFEFEENDPVDYKVVFRVN